MKFIVQKFTRKFFNSFFDAVVIFVCVNIEHVIREYESRRHVSSKFEECYVND
jgi:hypothetical protein